MCSRHPANPTRSDLRAACFRRKALSLSASLDADFRRIPETLLDRAEPCACYANTTIARRNCRREPSSADQPAFDVLAAPILLRLVACRFPPKLKVPRQVCCSIERTTTAMQA